ncbi:MAG: hypothetical protein Ta2D_08960 [Rickettsiales bacterium]|nr:MAG: hypothetical protein Ta2D_08960 [Rickettsiales bacterium]
MINTNFDGLILVHDIVSGTPIYMNFSGFTTILDNIKRGNIPDNLELEEINEIAFVLNVVMQGKGVKLQGNPNAPAIVAFNQNEKVFSKRMQQILFGVSNFEGNAIIGFPPYPNLSRSINVPDLQGKRFEQTKYNEKAYFMPDGQLDEIRYFEAMKNKFLLEFEFAKRNGKEVMIVPPSIFLNGVSQQEGQKCIDILIRAANEVSSLPNFQNVKYTIIPSKKYSIKPKTCEPNFIIDPTKPQKYVLPLNVNAFDIAGSGVGQVDGRIRISGNDNPGGLEENIYKKLAKDGKDLPSIFNPKFNSVQKSILNELAEYLESPKYVRPRPDYLPQFPKNVNNEYLNFRSFKDAVNYGKKHNIFDSKLVSMFHDDYIRDLQRDNFNPQYYLNKKYGDKTIIELNKDRATFLAGISKLYEDGKISLDERDTAYNYLYSFTQREYEELEKIMNAYHQQLLDKNNPLFKSNNLALLKRKVDNVSYNQTILSDALSSENMQFHEFNDKLNAFADCLDKKIADEEKYTLPKLAQKRKQAEKEKSVADILSPEKKNYAKWLTGVVRKGVEKIDEQKAEEYIKKQKISADYETKQVKKLKNEKDYVLRDLKQKIRKSRWFSDKRHFLKAQLARCESFYAESEKELCKKIQKERVEYYNKFNSIKMQEYQNAEIQPLPSANTSTFFAGIETGKTILRILPQISTIKF